MAAADGAIGVLGGTFNPVHNGHIAIAKSFLNSDYINSLLVLLAPKPPHKPNEKLANYSIRLRMLMAAFQSVENVKISGLEYTLSQPSYTYQTMRYLKKTDPETPFYLCLGEDSFNNFKDWHKWKGILEFCQLLVARRPGTEGDKDNNDLLKFTHFVEHSPIDISSFQIRERLRNDKSVDELVPNGVLQIINENGLYGDD